MSKSEHGGPAFPEDCGSGMSLRDYFAAKAMAALITNEHWEPRANSESGLANSGMGAPFCL